MDFAWVVDALHRGLRVTREAWRGDPPMYLYTSKTKNGKRTVMFCDGSKVDREACFCPDAVLDATDWEEYVDPKKGSAKAEEDRIDYARGVVHCGEDTGYMAEQLEMLADIYVEKISQRVAQLLQKTDVPLSKEDTNHVCTVYHRRRS